MIGGGAIAADEMLLAPARAVLKNGRYRRTATTCGWCGAFGEEAGMLGAALLALDGGPAVNGRLMVCPTPIGNMEDITLRVLSALREADVIAAEDTRHTRALLDRYGASAPLVSYHEHNEEKRAAELVGRMQAGEVVALVSDAGMPLVSDPGYVLVRACVGAGLAVEVLPGPSAALTALVASGLPSDSWRFVGFLPRKRGDLRRVLAAPGAGSLVAFESPKRVPATLAVLAEVDPDRQVAVARELTKLHEEVVRGTAAELAARYADAPPRGEVVLVVAPPAMAASDREAVSEEAVDAVPG